MPASVQAADGIVEPMAHKPTEQGANNAKEIEITCTLLATAPKDPFYNDIKAYLSLAE